MFDDGGLKNIQKIFTVYEIGCFRDGLFNPFTTRTYANRCFLTMKFSGTAGRRSQNYEKMLKNGT